MAPRTLVCPDCGETVRSGQLTCPSCGALLAAVSGGAIRPSRAGKKAGAEAPVGNPDPGAMTPARIESQVLPVAASDDPAPAPSVARGPATPLEPTSIRQTPVEGSATPIGDGGYLPPGTSMAPATLPDPAPAAAAATADPRAMPAPDARDAGDAPEAPGVVSGWDRARQDKVVGYATAAGAGLIAFGMFMPWSRVVIGSSGAEGLFNAWGLASPGFVLVLFWALAILTVSVIPNGIPVGDRSGLAGLILGVFCLGLVEPYVIGGLGAGIGVIVVMAGAFLLTVIGVLVVARDRHAVDD